MPTIQQLVRKGREECWWRNREDSACRRQRVISRVVFLVLRSCSRHVTRQSRLWFQKSTVR